MNKKSTNDIEGLDLEMVNIGLLMKDAEKLEDGKFKGLGLDRRYYKKIQAILEKRKNKVERYDGELGYLVKMLMTVAELNNNTRLHVFDYNTFKKGFSNSQLRVENIRAIVQGGYALQFIEVLKSAALQETESDRNVRIESIKAIGTCSDISIFTEVLKSAALQETESDRNVRIEAIKAIATCDDISIFHDIIRKAGLELSESDRNVRIEVMKVIAQHKVSIDYIDVVMMASLETYESDRNVRIEAIKAMIDDKLGKAWGRKNLEAFLRKISEEDSDLPVQRQAAESLGQLYIDLRLEMKKKIDAVNRKIGEAFGKLLSQAGGPVKTNLGTIHYKGGNPVDLFTGLDSSNFDTESKEDSAQIKEDPKKTRLSLEEIQADFVSISNGGIPSDAWELAESIHRKSQLEGEGESGELKGIQIYGDEQISFQQLPQDSKLTLRQKLMLEMAMRKVPMINQNAINEMQQAFHKSGLGLDNIFYFTFDLPREIQTVRLYWIEMARYIDRLYQRGIITPFGNWMGTDPIFSPDYNPIAQCLRNAGLNPKTEMNNIDKKDRVGIQTSESEIYLNAALITAKKIISNLLAYIQVESNGETRVTYELPIVTLYLQKTGLEDGQEHNKFGKNRDEFWLYIADIILEGTAKYSVGGEQFMPAAKEVVDAIVGKLVRYTPDEAWDYLNERHYRRIESNTVFEIEIIKEDFSKRIASTLEHTFDELDLLMQRTTRLFEEIKKTYTR